MDFIRRIIKDDLDAGRVSQIITRFPPEPNGCLHIGHAKAALLNFSIAQEFSGIFRLRYDDTNPEKETEEFVKSIEEDLHWLGISWEDEPRHASDYFDQFYNWAVELVKAGKAYIDNQTFDDINRNRGTPTKAGVDSPFRNRTPEENMQLLSDMKAGKFNEGDCVLRAKISMDHVNILMRDPIMYRIRRETHHRTGEKWCIYPMYDFAHGYEDSIEGVTHSLCSLEFENHRPLYDWFIDNVCAPSKPHQYEFARLNLTHTVLSKRHLRRLVEDGHVSGWDDPRMPTLCGLRRRGFPARSIRQFIAEIGVSKVNSLVDINFLHFHTRDLLNETAQRRIAVLNPIKLTISNWPQGKEEIFQAENIPGNPTAGYREIKFSGELWVERDDYMDNPPKKWFRLGIGKEVRLKYAYYITVTDVIRDVNGNPVEILCTYDPETLGGDSSDGRKVKGTIHWLCRSKVNNATAEIRLYDHLITMEDTAQVEEIMDFTRSLNPKSVIILTGAILEPSAARANPEERFQFLRNGYFVADRKEHKPGIRPVFNRIVGLRDSWAKIANKSG